MTAVADLELPSFDYTDPDLKGDRFHEVMRELRERSWIARTPLGFIVLDREASAHFLRSKAVAFPSLTIAEIFGISDGPLWEEMRRNIISLEGADHGRLRQLVNPAFTPRAAERWRPRMREFIRGLVDGVGDAQRFDFVESVARPYPAMTIAAVMGAPIEDAPSLHRWSTLIQQQFDAMALVENRPTIEAAVEELYAYLDELFEARRQSPGDDLLSQLMAAESEGDRLSHVECVNLVLNVLIGGVDTTQSQLAQAVRLFALHPDQWARLRAEPELVGAAVWEALRHEPITPFTARIVREEIEYREVTFPVGTVVIVASCTANRQPGVVSEPDRFDITADRGGEKPFTFGAGIHYCLGANLARAELEEALLELSSRWETVELAGEPEFDTVTGVYGLNALPLRVTTATS